jgi:3-hydroxyacyl-CoA dehydrogenase
MRPSLKPSENTPLEIKKAAVLGSGVMGSGIAAVLANAGIPVLLLDIVPKGAEDRNALAKNAIEKQAKGGTPGFAHPKFKKLVTPGNLEDDLDKLADVDWIVEVVLEKLEIKHDVYKKIEPKRKPGSIVSSNTSTIPLHHLMQGLPESFQRDFIVTHFFNPPRFMRLLEVVKSPTFDAARFESFKTFADIRLGKGVVPAKDTPGFLANRIGVYWLTAALIDAQTMGIRVEDADAVMGKPLGFPKTGVFGLYDLIGIDLMPLIAAEMLNTLPEKDAFRQLYNLPDLVKKMIADGYTGRKGKGGFYRLAIDANGKKSKEVIDLKTGEYRAEKKSKLESIDVAKAGLAALFNHKDIGGQYAASVMLKTLHYAASLVPEISDDIDAIDAAMRMGYNWKYGPFELIDRCAAMGLSGTEIVAQAFEKYKLPVPKIIQEARGKKLYDTDKGKRTQFMIGGQFAPVPIPGGSLMLSDIKLTSKPITKNGSAAIWDLGDGILCFELTSKSNTWDPENLKLLGEATDMVKANFKGLVIGSDAEHFSFGANIGYFLLACNTASWWAISDMVKLGQNVFMGLKYAPFPSVSALSGMALGGGCELNLHVSAVQAHIESYIGLVEAGIGVVPGWGGCKELLLRHMAAAEASGKAIMKGQKPDPFMAAGPMPAISKTFEYISMAKVAGSAAEAQDMMILNAKSRITMNRRRVLSDAKELCIELGNNYVPPEPKNVRLPGASAYTALMMAVEGFRKNGKATPHDEVVAGSLARVITGGDTDITREVSEQQLLDLEHEVFMYLCKTQATRDRIAHMLGTSKPLRN